MVMELKLQAAAYVTGGRGEGLAAVTGAMVGLALVFCSDWQGVGAGRDRWRSQSDIVTMRCTSASRCGATGGPWCWHRVNSCSN